MYSARLHQGLFQVRRAVPTHENAQERAELPVQDLREEVHTVRPPLQARQVSQQCEEAPPAPEAEDEGAGEDRRPHATRIRSLETVIFCMNMIINDCRVFYAISTHF